jgi:hypothetical protein
MKQDDGQDRAVDAPRFRARIAGGTKALSLRNAPLRLSWREKQRSANWEGRSPSQGPRRQSKEDGGAIGSYYDTRRILSILRSASTSFSRRMTTGVTRCPKDNGRLWERLLIDEGPLPLIGAVAHKYNKALGRGRDVAPDDALVQVQPR